MMRVALLLGAVLSNLVFVVPAAADQPCEESDESEWMSEGVSYWDLSNKDAAYWDGDPIDLQAGNSYWENVPADSGLIYPVIRDLPVAVAMLASQSFMPLNQAQVMQFSAATSAEVIKRRNLQLEPYLVRAVFPRSRPSTFGVRWRGSTLYVWVYEFGGCEAYTKHPVIIFLERQPETVKVTAGSGG